MAWDRFRDVEAAGGLAAALASGVIAEEAEACWEARRARLVTRAEAITGVSEFPDLDEDLPIRPPALPGPLGPLPLRRRSEPFEALRDAADAAMTTPTVRLVTVGVLADHNVRSTFATNLYAVGGIRVGSGSGSPVAVVCGSDDGYRAEGVAAVAALRAEGVVRIHLAARAGALDDDLVAALRAAGVDEFVHAGADVVDLLERTQADLGLRPGPDVATGAAEGST